MLSQTEVRCCQKSWRSNSPQQHAQHNSFRLQTSSLPTNPCSARSSSYVTWCFQVKMETEA